MLPAMAGHRVEFVKDTAPVVSGKRLVAILYCSHQLLLRHSTHASSQAIADQFSGIILLRQCASKSSNRFGCQGVMTAGFQYWPVLMMALSIVSNFRIHAVRASFFGLPAASNR